MAIDKDNLLETILTNIKELDYIKMEEFPDIDLYMDQVTTFMENHLNGSKRHEEDKILTKTMINNYAKNHLMPPPDKKKYSREHMLILTFIYYLKNILSINDIQKLLSPLTEKYFHADGDIKLEDIYDQIIELEMEQIEPAIKDVTTRFQKAENSFQDTPEEQQDFLQFFTFICLLCFDIYLKKGIVEKLIDFMPDIEN